MKLRHFTMLFSILFLMIGGTIWQQNRYRKQLELEKLYLDRCIDSAADAAAGYLAVYDDGILRIDKDGALEAFFNNMYAGLGVLDNIPAQQQLISCVPFLVAVDNEGYYLWHLALNTTDEGIMKYSHYWSRKRYFHDFEENQADGTNRAAVIECVLEEAAAEYNIIAEKMGLKYCFLLPELDDCLWLRGITEPGILVFVQGLPLRYGNQLYSRFSFAGAVIHKRQEEIDLQL